jgi:hypothetical protein
LVALLGSAKTPLSSLKGGRPGWLGGEMRDRRSEAMDGSKKVEKKALGPMEIVYPDAAGLDIGSS